MQSNTCEEKYNELVENANSVILRFDEKGNVTFFNEFAQKFFGFSQSEILGKNIVGTIVPASDFTGLDLRPIMEDIVNNPQKYVNNENENMTKDGRHVWVSWTNKPIFGDDGILKEILSIGNDITKLKETEVELKKANELAEAAGSIGTVICRPDWKIKAANGAAGKYLCLDITDERSEEDIVKLFFKYYSPSVSEEKIKGLSQERLSFDLVRPASENNKALYLQVNRELFRMDKQVVSIIFSLQDVTEKRKEEILKQDFLGVISHKLRTPVAFIKQSSSYLKSGKLGELSEKQKPFVNGIADEAEKLDNMISNLLNFVAISDKNISASKEEVRLSEAIPKIMKPLIDSVKNKPVDFELDCPDKGLSVNMSGSYFNLVIENLMENSIKFNDKSRISVRISVKKEGGLVLLSFSDNGSGIPAEEQERIFAEFYQPEKYFTGNVAGAGLGLSLVKKIMSASGGAVNLSSEIGKGSTFNLRFKQA